MSDTNTGKQGGAPALPNNFTSSTPVGLQDMAPSIGSPSFKTSPNSKDRGKDGTSK